MPGTKQPLPQQCSGETLRGSADTVQWSNNYMGLWEKTQHFRGTLSWDTMLELQKNDGKYRDYEYDNETEQYFPTSMNNISTS